MESSTSNIRLPNFNFAVNFKKIKNLYDVRYDKTSIDRLVIKLKKHLHDKLIAISVRGLDTGKNEYFFKQNPYTFKQIALCWKSNYPEKVPYRQYYLKLYLDYYKLPLRICNMDWIKGFDKNLEIGNEEDFNYNIEFSYNLIEEVLKECSRNFMVSVFCGYNPASSWPARAYIKLIVDLNVGPNDLFMHSGLTNLTDFGLNQIDEVKNTFIDIINNEGIDISPLFLNKSKVLQITRRAENIVRQYYKIKDVGDSFVNETLLANLVSSIFPDAIRQYRGKWLGKYILDIYIPSKRLAIEYQGEQHYKPIKRFGGEEKLIKQKERDLKVRQICNQNGITLLEWPYERKVTNRTVEEFLFPFK
jgi:very-short-patch-repair endonuclease